MKTLILLLLVSISARASFVDPKEIRTDLKPIQPADSNITEAEYNALVKEFKDVYTPIVKGFGASLTVLTDWKNNTPNASATQLKTNWLIRSTGGLARQPEMTRDGYLLVLCHEMGHHLGGFSMSPPRIPIPVPGLEPWAANEGQADYFATQVCAKRMWRNHGVENAKFRETSTADVRARCDANWSSTLDQDLCYRVLTAVDSVAKTMAALTKKPVPEFSTPDSTIVDKTNHGHPAPQCRMDTYLQAAICQVQFNEQLIPGKSVSQGIDSEEAEREAAGVSCTNFSGAKVGLRPSCCFKARL